MEKYTVNDLHRVQLVFIIPITRITYINSTMRFYGFDIPNIVNVYFYNDLHNITLHTYNFTGKQLHVRFYLIHVDIFIRPRL